MCVALPGRIVMIEASTGPSRPGVVDFGDGRRQSVDLAMLPDAEIGDYVIIHSGFAISRVDPQMAMESHRLMTGRDAPGPSGSD